MSFVKNAIGEITGSRDQSRAANRAADAQAEAARQANELTWKMFEQSRTDQTPWREAGANALAQMSQRMGAGGDLSRQFGPSDMARDDGYQFRMAEGLRGVNNSSVARGGLLSGAALKAASRYSQDFASNEYSNAYNRYNTNQTNQFNRLASIAGVGQQSAQQTGQQGMAAAQTAGNNLLGAGNARASAYVTQGNQWGKDFGTLSNIAGQFMGGM